MKKLMSRVKFIGMLLIIVQMFSMVVATNADSSQAWQGMYASSEQTEVHANEVVSLASYNTKKSGKTPRHALPLMMGLNKGSVAPGEELWLTYTPFDPMENAFMPLTLTFLFTPDDGHRIHRVHIDLFEFDSNTQKFRQFGAGSIVSRDGDYNTGEKLWKGWLMNNVTYYIRIQNGVHVGIDYWLFTDDIINAELGEKTNSSDAPVYVPPGMDPNHTIPLVHGVNIGHMEPHSDRWFKIRITTFEGTVFHPLTLSLFFTPDDGNRVYKVHMDLFDPEVPRIWSRGYPFTFESFGSGMVRSFDGDHHTGEQIWKGIIVNNQDFYVRLRNDNEIPIDYWLFTFEMMNPQLGDIYDQEMAKQTAEQKQATRNDTPETSVVQTNSASATQSVVGQTEWYDTVLGVFDPPNPESLGRMEFVIASDGQLMYQGHTDVYASKSNNYRTNSYNTNTNDANSHDNNVPTSNWQYDPSTGTYHDHYNNIYYYPQNDMYYYLQDGAYHGVPAQSFYSPPKDSRTYWASPSTRM